MEIKYITADESDAAINELSEQNKELNEKLKEYKNKFSQYTKEQAGLMFKIQKVKQKIIKKDLKMTGRNTFNKYNYFELKDITPAIVDALLEEGLCSHFFTKDNNIYLQIIDAETGAWQQWHTPLRAPAQNNKAGDVGQYMKINQALKTYGRRDLWLLSLEIIEPVTIEQSQEPKQTIYYNQIKNPISHTQKPIKQDKTETQTKTPKEILNQFNEDMDRGGYKITLERANNYLTRKVNNKEITPEQKEQTLKLLEFKPEGVGNGINKEN